MVFTAFVEESSVGDGLDAAEGHAGRRREDGGEASEGAGSYICSRRVTGSDSVSGTRLNVAGDQKKKDYLSRKSRAHTT